MALILEIQGCSSIAVDRARESEVWEVGSARVKLVLVDLAARGRGG